MLASKGLPTLFPDHCPECRCHSPSKSALDVLANRHFWGLTLAVSGGGASNASTPSAALRGSALGIDGTYHRP